MARPVQQCSEVWRTDRTAVSMLISKSTTLPQVAKVKTHGRTILYMMVVSLSYDSFIFDHLR